MIFSEKSELKIATPDYLSGFNSMLRDDDVRDKNAPIPAEEGLGNSYSTEFRGYDPRNGRWLSIDPLAYKFPWSSPYVAMGNNPVCNIDPNGRDFYKNETGNTQWFDNDVSEFIVGESESKVTWSNIGTELLEFNGESLKYSQQMIDDEGKRSVKSTEYKAVSGSAKPISNEITGNVKLYFDYSVERQKMKNEGPIPEGLYSITVNDMQYRLGKTHPLSQIFRNLGLSFREKSWGNYRIGIKPEQANTYGRSGFTIHGGWEWGSIGCIDLTGGIDKFSKNYLKNYSTSEKTYLKVNYDKNLLINVTPIIK